MLSKRCRLGVAALNGKIYAVGGYDGSSTLNSVEIFDPITNKWSYASPMKVGRRRVAIVATMDRIYAIGGYDGKNLLRTVEMYNPDTKKWSIVASMKKPKLYTPSTLNNSNQSYTFIGLGRAGRFGQH